MANKIYNKRHFFLESLGSAQKFTSPGGGGGSSPIIPARNRIAHSGKLRGDLSTADSSPKCITANIEFQTRIYHRAFDNPRLFLGDYSVVSRRS